MKTQKLWVFLTLITLSICQSPVKQQDAIAAPLTPNDITQVWANNGQDKVWQSELRATSDPSAVYNSVWDGTTISLFGARNEVVGFNLVLEAPSSDAANVEVSLTSLTGPGGASITTRSTSTDDDLFNYIGRNIELYFVRYLEIRGLSHLGYENYYDERHVPERCRRPHDGRYALPGTDWEDRPCHNQLSPDIAVPLELHTPFTIAAGTNQSIWSDIYVPKTTPPGIYEGTIEITEDGAPARQVPIHLRVRNFELPDLPNARTMLVVGEDINAVYLDEPWPNPGTSVYTQSLALADRHFQLAHRHKISLIGGGTLNRMDEAWTARLTGELFTSAQEYDGVGVGVGNNVYSVGTYGSWRWMWDEDSEQEMWDNTDAWVNWFDAQAFSTPTEYFLYLIDESHDYPQTEQWAQWMDNNPGPGQRLKSMATIGLPAAAAETPSLDVPTTYAGFGITDVWQAAADQYLADPDKWTYIYNGSRPATGTFLTEDDGVALRALAWTQYKKQFDRWFYWESTYYVNFQAYGYNDPLAQTNVFRQAQTFGRYSRDDDVEGETGWNYSNGDGVLFYPGTDTRYPEDSYDLMGPLASLRLKLWRRGIQDVDYLTLAAAIDPQRTAEIVKEMIPQVLWEVGVETEDDPTYVYSDISWSTNPDVWEAARAELADIIERGNLVLHGTPQDQAIRLTWEITNTLSSTSTWQIDYSSETGTVLLPPITIPTSTVRSHTLTDLTNYVWYTVTLNAMVDTTSVMSDTVRVMPTNIFLYLPLVLKQ
ncbi:MAG: DUF4091 domain-containing protein [Chloroflexi bacterium]|nr:DUF4091 domain-containing protein [Chloroflexota bacterium]